MPKDAFQIHFPHHKELLDDFAHYAIPLTFFQTIRSITEPCLFPISLSCRGVKQAEESAAVRQG